MKDLASRPENAPFYDRIADLSIQELKAFADKSLEDFKVKVRELEVSELKNNDFLKEAEQIEFELDQNTGGITLLEDLHPKKTFRDFSSKFVVKFSAVLTDYNFNQKIYEKYKNDVDPSSLDEQGKYLYRKTMDGYRRLGVDQPKEVRDELTKISKEMSQQSTDFSKNISENTPTLTFKESQLKGCFEEFISTRREKNGDIKVLLVSNSTLHILQNCSVKETREKVRAASLNYAKDPNWKVLPAYLNNAEKKAQLVGYKNFAELSTEDKMIEDPEKAAEFIKELIDSTKDRVKLELNLIKEFKQKVNDDSELSYADIDYYSNQIASKLSTLDEESLKQFFPYQHVKNEILTVFEEMFNLRFIPDKKAKVWNDDVEAYIVKEDTKIIARFYLDMHPRKGKYNHACSIGIVSGVEGLSTPQNILLCNFNKPIKGSAGLQSLDEVTTFFHEFGHLIHAILGGQTVRWTGLAGTRVQRDFVEAPSQLLEEILLDPQVLKRLSRHVETSNQIDDALISSIHKKESIFDKAKLKGIGVARQAALSRESLEVYTTTNITNDDLTKIEQTAVTDALSVYGDYYMIYEFGHLMGYYSNYYTYMWSLAIAKDLFTKFNKKDLLDPKVAEHYRKTILEPGGSKPAAELVKDFLGRDWNMDAFREYLKEGEELLART
jgi:thimet oligopeptidase